MGNDNTRRIALPDLNITRANAAALLLDSVPDLYLGQIAMPAVNGGGGGGWFFLFISMIIMLCYYSCYYCYYRYFFIIVIFF